MCCQHSPSGSASCCSKTLLMTEFSPSRNCVVQLRQRDPALRIDTHGIFLHCDRETRKQGDATREFLLQAMPRCTHPRDSPPVCTFSGANFLSTTAARNHRPLDPTLLRRNAVTAAPRVIDDALTVRGNEGSTTGPQIPQLSLYSQRARARRDC